MSDMEPARNIGEYSVSEISAAVRRTVEDAFGYVRVRGEISGFRGVHASGHCYFALKDDRSRIEAVIWRSTLQRLKFKPEEGIEVVATGHVTTFGGQSKYQIVIDALEPAGVGALMALLEERRKKLAAEGLFADERKRPLPYLPRVIGVVTSPTGAVISDILHRLGDRFPSRVVIWPVRVQGETSAAEVAAAINGFNALPAGGAIARPDLIIVARGGGSLEDLWSFNEELVVRAAAASAIPLISAIGHETDVTLIDHAADRRAPTPTAAAEMAVPVRSELIAGVEELAIRLFAALARRFEGLRGALRSAARALPRADDLLATERRTLDSLAERISLGLLANARVHRTAYLRIGARLTTDLLARLLTRRGEVPIALSERLTFAFDANIRGRRADYGRAAAGLVPSRLRRITALRADHVRGLVDRKRRSWAEMSARRRTNLDGLANLLEALSYRSVLERGFALVTDDNRAPVRSVRDAPVGKVLGIRFHDGDIAAVSRGADDTPRPRRRRKAPGGSDQGTLL